MSNHHTARPGEWADQENWACHDADSSCILELRARVEALEATQHAHIDTSHLTDAERKQIREELARPATFAELLMPPPRTTTPITRDRDKTGDYIIVHDTPALNSLLVDRIATDAELCQVYNEKTTLRAVYDLGRQHGAAPIRSGPESPLVERVADAIAAQATSAGIVNDRPARAAILEVAAWLKEEGYSTLQAEALAREANQ
jgi:hypothetical protein